MNICGSAENMKVHENKNLIEGHPVETANKARTTQYTIQVVRRAAKVLRVLSEEDQGLTLDELSRKACLNRTTVFRILATLRQEGLIERTKNTPVLYTIGLQNFILAAKMLSGQGIMVETQSILDSLAIATDETVGLFVPWGNKSTCVASAISPRPQQYYMEVGKSIPLCVGAEGKILLAHMRYEDSVRIIQQTLPVIERFPGTPSQVEVLLAELESIRKENFAVSRYEWSVRGTSIAVPIRSLSDSVVAALSMSAAADSIPEERIPEIVSILSEGSSQLTKSMFSTEF